MALLKKNQTNECENAASSFKIDSTENIEDDQQKNDSLNLSSLKMILNNIDRSKDSMNNHLVSSLISIADIDCSKCKSFDDTMEQLRCKRYAVECLKQICHKRISHEFCEQYYFEIVPMLIGNNDILSVCTAMLKLDNYMSSTSNLNNKFRLLQTLSYCLTESTVNPLIFDKIAPSEWRRELLTTALLQSFEEISNSNISFCIHKIDALNNILKQNATTTIENVLETLIHLKNEWQFNIQFINDVLFSLCSQPFLLSFIKDSKNFNDAQILVKQTIHREISSFISKFADEEEREIFLDITSNYDINLIDRLISTINKNNFSDITSSLCVLEDCGKKSSFKEKCLKELLQNFDTCVQWKYKLMFIMIKYFLVHKFPEYNNHPTDYSALLDAQYLKDIFTNSHKNKKNSTLPKFPEDLPLVNELNIILTRFTLNCSITLKQTLKIMESFIQILDSKIQIIQLINAFEILNDYECYLTDDNMDEISSMITLNDIQTELNKYVIKKTFPGTYEKSSEQLIQEFKELNSNETISNIDIDDYNHINFNIKPTLILHSKNESINCWNKDRIKEWIKNFKLSLFNKETVSNNELLAVIKRTVELTTDVKLREVQFLTAIQLLKCTEGKGRLAQVNTGEGKTIIIAVIAAYHALMGNKVDIITSSSLLAIPQSKQYEKFYSTLGLSVAHNIHSSLNYKCDIIYGTNNSFQADILRDEFRKRGIRKGRTFDIAIVDEVDNMLIDENNHILMLSCTMPGMDYLGAILASIYIQIKYIASCLEEKHGRVYFLQQETAFDENGKAKDEVLVNEILIEQSKKDFIMQCTETHVRKLIRDNVEVDDNYPEIQIPNHLRELISKVQLKKWINSAISSIFYYVNGEKYIIKDGKVVIVDANNTGVLKKSSAWSNGLHQFLQMKHGARIDAESMSTNYMSNVGIIKRYNKRIYGLTGTLGSSSTKQLLNKIYDVNSIIVPPFKMKQHKYMRPIIVNNIDEWYMEIVKSCLRKLSNGQAVLIIMKFIRETEKVAEIFENSVGYDVSKIKMYKTDTDSVVVENKLKPGEIVITTNIAGRGTDFQLSKDIDKQGGLHVCLTFLPINSRVEEQNLGRTSRQGNCGTSQLVLYHRYESNIENLKSKRNKKQDIAVERMLKDLSLIITKDTIFQEFCQVRGKIKFRNSFVKSIEEIAVEERFAIWLQINDAKIRDSNTEDALRDFKIFCDKILMDDTYGKLIENPYIYTKIGNKYLSENKLDSAIDEYTLAIDLDSSFAESAYYNRAFALIKKYGENINKHEYYINKAVDDLKAVRKLIKKKQYSLNLLQNASDGEVFSRHISNRLNLYNIYNNSIEIAIGCDRAEINEQIDELKSKLTSENISAENKKKISETIENLTKEKENIGVIGRAKLKGMDVKIDWYEDDYLPEDDKKSHENELEEFELNGWKSAFNISELPPIDWNSVIGLLTLGFTQLIVGAALAVFTLGAGASLAMSLIIEGISDIITAIKDGIINRDFDWATWAIQKAISITVSIICAGFSGVKDVVKTTCAGVKNVASLSTKVLTETSKQGWKIVAKKVGIELAKGVAKEVTVNLINYGVDKTLIPMIEEKIVDIIKDPIYEALINNPTVKIMLDLDNKNKNFHYENLIISMGMKILNPQQNNKIKEIALDIAKRLADNKIKAFSAARQVATAGVALARLTTLTSEFINELNKSINERAERDKINQISSDKETVTQIDTNDERESSEKINPEKIEDDIDLDKCGNEEEQVKLEKKIITPGNISSKLVKIVSTQMINIIKGKIIAPVINSGVNFTMEKITQTIDDSLHNEIEDYRAYKRIINNQNRGFQNTKKKDDYKKFKNLNDDTMNRVDVLINDVANGGPAGLPHLGAISDAINRPIAVYNEQGKLKYIIGEDKKGKPIEIQHFKVAGEDNNNIGHFTLRDNKEPFNKDLNKNMCLFNVIAEQVGTEPNKLKQSTLSIMKNNKEILSKQVLDITRLEMHQSDNLLYGGAQYNGTNPDQAKNFIINSNGRRGFDKDNPAHSDFHVPITGNVIDQLNAVSDVTGKRVEVYDHKGNLKYIIGGDKKEGEPIKLQYNKPKGNTSDEYFSKLGSNDRYRLHDPTDMTFYKIINEQVGGNDADKLKSDVSSKMNEQIIPKDARCIENESRKRNKTGYASTDEQAFVTHYALQTESAKKAFDKLNQYNDTVNNTEEFTRQEVHISAAELNLPRTAYGGLWKKGKVKCTWPVTDVVLVLQHYPGQQNNPKARVHIQTNFPRPPRI